MSGVTHYTGSFVPAPHSHAPERALIAWAVLIALFVIGAVLIDRDANAHYADLHSPPVACDPGPAQACALYTSRGVQLVVFTRGGDYSLATLTPPPIGG